MYKLRNYRKQESGQAILLIAVLMVALIASLGLALDGGGMFLMYRDVQNATDAAGLAAAYDLCTNGDPEYAARQSAELNGFVDGTDNVIVDVEHPVTSRTDLANPAEQYVLINISSEKPSYFIQIVYGGPLRVSASALVRCQPGSDFGFPANSAVVALSDCSDGSSPIRYGGSSYTGIQGTVFSNCTDSDSIWVRGFVGVEGTVCTIGDIRYNSGRIIHESPEILTEDDCPYDQITGDELADPLGLSDMSGTELCGSLGLDEHGDPVPAPALDSGYSSPPAVIDDPHTVGNDSDTSTWEQWYPGHYSTIDIPSNRYAFLNPGVYCVSGDVDVKGGLYGENVLIYQDCTGCTFKFNANADVHLTPMGSGDYEGLLVYSRSENRTNGNKFNGSNNMDIYGTMYFPQSTCEIAGSAGNYVYAQFVCWELEFTGNSESIIAYDPASVYSRPAQFGIEE